MDIARIKTDKRLAVLERRIDEQFAQAQVDIRKMLERYLKDFKIEEKKLVNKISDLKKQKQEYKQIQTQLEKLRKSAFLYKNQTTGKISQIAELLTKKNELASAMINSNLNEVYRLNYNYINSSVKNIGKRLGIRFDIITQETLTNLLKDNIDLLPAETFTRINYAQDFAYNTRILKSAVTRGIITGASIDDIAKGILEKTNTTLASAIRSARTAITNAENSGRQDRLNSDIEQFERYGYTILKRWRATHDDRTRHSHVLLNGETIKGNETFSNGCRYPGDSRGRPEEVYNCRCTLEEIVKKL